MILSTYQPLPSVFLLSAPDIKGWCGCNLNILISSYGTPAKQHNYMINPRKKGMSDCNWPSWSSPTKCWKIISRFLYIIEQRYFTFEWQRIDSIWECIIKFLINPSQYLVVILWFLSSLGIRASINLGVVWEINRKANLWGHPESSMWSYCDIPVWSLNLSQTKCLYHNYFTYIPSLNYYELHRLEDTSLLHHLRHEVLICSIELLHKYRNVLAKGMVKTLKILYLRVSYTSMVSVFYSRNVLKPSNFIVLIYYEGGPYTGGVGTTEGARARGGIWGIKFLDGSTIAFERSTSLRDCNSL